MPKTGLSKRGRFSENCRKFLDMGGASAGNLLAVLLDAGGAQSGQTVLVDGELPGQEFVNRQGVTAAGFLKREETTADGSHNLGLTADDPPFGTGRR